MQMYNCIGCDKLRRFVQSSTHRCEDYCEYGGGLIPLAKIEMCPREEAILKRTCGTCGHISRVGENIHVCEMITPGEQIVVYTSRKACDKWVCIKSKGV